MSEAVTAADAHADLQRVAAELGHPPTIAEYRTHGQYSPPTVAKHHDGSYTAARAAALGCADGRQAEHRREELLADLQQVAEDVGGEPSKTDYEDRGDYALSTMEYRFESWIDAKKEADVYDGLDEGPTREELIEDLQRVDEEHSGAVSQVLYQEHGEWSKMAVQRKFDGWEAGCQEAGVTRPDRGPRTEETAELLEDIARVAEKVGHAPSRGEYHEHGEFSRQMAINRLGSWPEAVRHAGYEPRDPGGQPGELNANWEGGVLYYGEDWHEQRRLARNRDGFECAACGMAEANHVSKYGYGLEVHHIVPLREFDDPATANELKNLVTLCSSHHGEYESLPNGRAKELIGER